MGIAEPPALRSRPEIQLPEKARHIERRDKIYLQQDEDPGNDNIHFHQEKQGVQFQILNRDPDEK